MNNLIAFLKDVKLELSRVNWPTKEQAAKYTGVVIGISLAVALFLGGLDLVFQFILNRIL